MRVVGGSRVIQAGVVNWKAIRFEVLLLVILVVCGCAAGGEVKVDGKIGVVDAARVLNETNIGKKAKDSLSVFSKNRQALIEMDEKELRRMEEDFGRQASVLSPTAKREREEQFRRRVTEYQQKAGEMNREVQEKQKDVLEGFREKVGLIVGKVSKRLGLLVVIDKGKGGPTLYNDEGLDITGQIIDEFNREYP
jgi:outer membrane protein